MQNFSTCVMFLGYFEQTKRVLSKMYGKKIISVCNHDFVQFFSHIIPRDISLTMLNFSSSRFATQKSQKHIIQADS